MADNSESRLSKLKHNNLLLASLDNDCVLGFEIRWDIFIVVLTLLVFSRNPHW